MLSTSRPAVVGFAWALAAQFAMAQAPCAPADLSKLVDEYVETQRKSQQIPGLAVLVVHQGETVKAQGFGLANVEHQVPVTAETIFQSGSVGKQFTATAVMMLVEEGQLALDDPVGKHLPGAPAAWEPITIRQLLSHTAGVPAEFAPKFDLQRDYTEQQLLAITFGLPLKFPPGTNWLYSNPGYVTLGILIHQVTGQFYGEFLQQRVFKPLGMSATRIISETDIVPHRAAGYRLVQGELKNQTWVSPSLNTTADGSLYLNLQDLAKWDAALNSEQLLKRASLETMWTPVRLADGKPHPAGYGFGWLSKQVAPGHRLVEHSGSWQGFTTHIARYLDDQLTVVVLTNLSAESTANPGRIAHGVAGLYVPELKLDGAKKAAAN